MYVLYVISFDMMDTHDTIPSGIYRVRHQVSEERESF